MYLFIHTASALQFILSVIALVIVVVILSYPLTNGWKELGLAMACIAIWTFCAAMESSVVQTDAKIFWAKMSFIGISFASTFLYISITHLMSGRRLSRNHWIAALVMPVLILLAVFTNEFHHLFWTGFLPGDPRFNVLIFLRGPLWFVTLIYQYILLLGSTFIVVNSMGQEITRRKAITLCLGIIPPWITSIMFLTGYTFVPHMDITPLGFFLTIPIMFFGVDRYGLFDITNSGQRIYSNNSNDSVVIIDDLGKVVELNLAARHNLSIGIGANIQSLKELAQSGVFPLTMPIIQGKRVSISSQAGQRVYSLSSSPVLSSRKQQIGTVLVFRDVTTLDFLANELREVEVEAIQAAERQKLGQEIHDRISQGMYSLSLFTASAKNHALRGNSVAALDAITEIDQMSQQVIRETNLLFYELEPKAFGRVGLKSALTEQAKAIKNRFDVEFEIEVGNAIDLPSHVQREIYMIITEILNILLNISRPDKINLTLASSEGKTQMGIVIFSNKMIKSSLIKNHIDKFDELQEKILRLDGSLEFNEPTPNNQIIVVVLPISKSESRL